jgi:hypothetical protein
MHRAWPDSANSLLAGPSCKHEGEALTTLCSRSRYSLHPPLQRALDVTRLQQEEGRSSVDEQGKQASVGMEGKAGGLHGQSGIGKAAKPANELHAA